MSGQEVAAVRIVLNNEINRIDNLVKAFKFQEAEEDFPGIERLYEDLTKLLNSNNKTHDNIRLNCRIMINMLSQSIENGLEKRDAGKKKDGNVAFKCNWNDMNYMGVCSKSAYNYNQVYGGPWCLLSKCRQFINLPVPPILTVVMNPEPSLTVTSELDGIMVHVESLFTPGKLNQPE